jgi:hypothetical protein
MRLNATRLGSIASSRSFGDQLDDLAGQVPNLDLNFARNKSLIDDYSGTTLVTHTRASSGTYVGSDGVLRTAATDVPRFDHNPQTGESLGLLVEEQRTNLLLRSEEFNNVSWINNESTDNANVTAAPNGATEADELIENSTSNLHYLYQIITKAASSITYAFSVYVKRATSGTRNVMVALTDGTTGGYGVIFDPDDGSIVSASVAIGSTAGWTLATPSPGVLHANGWWRFSVVITSNTSTRIDSVVYLINGTTLSYLGDNASNIYLWGAQLESGAFPTSYIPTVASTVTRAADVAQITGSNFSSWYNQTEGSFFCSITAPKGNVIFGTGDTFDNTQYVTVAASNNVSIRFGGSDQAILTAPVSSSANTNIALGYASNSFAAVSNGGTISTDTAGNVPAAQIRLKIGSSSWDITGSNNLNGTIKRLTYWPTRLSNEVLQRISQ